MIEQQLYTRSSNGYFLQAPGFDTVRFSSGLSESFVQKNSDLFSYNGKNVRDIQAAVTIITRTILNDGLVALVGANPYKYMSYDGLKEVFIAHAYYTGTDDLDEQVKDVRQIAGVTEFIRQHNDGSNEPLPQLSVIPFETRFSEADIVNAVNQRLTGKFISKIVYSALVSAFTEKKIYIIPQDITDVYMVLHTLKTIYYYLPFSVRKKLGYTTLLNNQSIPEGVNIAFVPQTYRNEILGGYLFGSNISDHFCFDFSTKEVINDSGIDLYSEIPYIKFVEKLSEADKTEGAKATIETIAEITKDKQISIDLFNEIVDVIIGLSEDEAAIIASLKKYRNLSEKCNKNPLFKLIYDKLECYKNSSNTISINAFKELVATYDYITEDFKTDVLDNYIIEALRMSTDNNAEFYHRFDIACANTEIETIVVSRFIVKNDIAIRLKFERELSKESTIVEVCNKVKIYECNEVFVEDGLIENQAFNKVYRERVSKIISSNKNLATIKELLIEGMNFKTESLNNTTNSIIQEEIESYIGDKLPTDFALEELDILIDNFEEYIGKEFFAKAKEAKNYFNVDADIVEMLSLIRKATPEIKSFLINYFKSNKPEEKSFFAYTVSCMKEDEFAIYLDKAFENLQNMDLIVAYTKWLTREFYYHRDENNLLSTKGNANRFERYADLANSIFKGINSVKVELSSKEASSFVDNIRKYMKRSEEDFDEMYKAFEKSVKKVTSGKSVPDIVYKSDEEDRKEKSKDKLKKKEKTFPKCVTNSKKSKESKNSAIIIILIIIGLIAVGFFIGIGVSQGKASNNKESTTAYLENEKVEQTSCGSTSESDDNVSKVESYINKDKYKEKYSTKTIDEDRKQKVLNRIE